MLPTSSLKEPAQFSVPIDDTVDIHASLHFLSRSGDDLLDRWDGRYLIRTIRTSDEVIPYLCEVSSEAGSNAFHVLLDDPRHLPIVERVVRNLFPRPPDSFPSLLASDPALRQIYERFRGLRPLIQHDPLLALVRSISAQQVNLQWAATTRSRLANQFGDRHDCGECFVYSLSAQRLAEADPAGIRALQFTLRKAESIVCVARELVAGRLTLEELEALPDDAVIERLTSLKGIGTWSAEWFLCRTMGRPRVVAGDLGVRKAVGRLYLNGAMPTELEVRELTAHWKESASHAQALALHALASGS